MVFPCPAGAFSCGTSSYKITIFVLSPSFTAIVFPVRQVRFRAEQVATKSSIVYAFQTLRLAFFGRLFLPSPSFTAMVFPCPAGAFSCGTSGYKIIIFPESL